MKEGLISNGSHEKLRERLDSLTTLGVNVSTIFFVALQVPQIIKDFEEFGTGVMKDLAWSGFVSGSMGNLLLATYFSGVNEWAQVRVQAIGAITNYFVASQVYAAGYFPSVQFWSLAAVLGVGLLIPLLFALGTVSLEKFALWQEATIPLGLASLVFCITSTFSDDSFILLTIFAVGFVIGILLLFLKPRIPILAPLMAKLGGWLATFLFMWMPLPQIYRILTVGKDAAAAFSMGFTVLATFGNGLGSTRAFVIKEKVWFVGSFYGLMVGGWLTAGFVSALDPAQCPSWVFALYTIVLAIYFFAIVAVNGRAQQESFRQQIRFLCIVKT